MTKNNAALFSVTFLLALTSFLSYFKLRQLFWAAELQPYVFCGLASLFLMVALVWVRDELGMSIVDKACILFFTYSISAAYLKGFPQLPSDTIYTASGSLVFYIGLRLIGPSPYFWLNLWRALLFVVLLQACWGIGQYAGLLPIYDTLNRVQGGFINPGIYGCFMAVGAVLSFYLCLTHKGSKWLLVTLICIPVIIGIALWLSQSRTAYVAAFIGITLLMAFKFRTNSSVVLFRYKIAGFVSVGILLAVVICYLWQMNPESVSGRFLIWKISMRMIVAHPFLGIGYGNFFTAYGDHQAQYFMSAEASAGEILTAGMNYYPFNELLGILVETGVLGLFLFLALVVLTLKSAWLQLKSSDQVLLPIVVLVVILIFGLFSYPLQSPVISCVCYISVANISSYHKVNSLFRFRSLYKYLAIVPLSLLFILSLQKINALSNWKVAKENILYAEGDALRKYQEIYPALSCNGAFLFNYGAELAEIGIYEQSLPMLCRAAHYGNGLELQSRLAAVSAALNQHKAAEQYYLIAAHMDPKRFVPLFDLFNYYKERGLSKKAANIARQIVQKQVKVPSAKIDEIKNLAFQYLNELNKSTYHLN